MLNTTKQLTPEEKVARLTKLKANYENNQNAEHRLELLHVYLDSWHKVYKHNEASEFDTYSIKLLAAFDVNKEIAAASDLILPLNILAIKARYKLNQHECIDDELAIMNQALKGGDRVDYEGLRKSRDELSVASAAMKKSILQNTQPMDTKLDSKYGSWGLTALANNQIAAHHGDDILGIYDVETGATLKALNEPKYRHKGDITRLITLSDGRVVSCYYKDTLRIWDLSDLNNVSFESLEDEGHSNDVSYKPLEGEEYPYDIFCAVELPGGYLASGYRDATIRIWNLKTKSLERTIDAHPLNPDGHEKAVYCLAVTPNGEQIISGSYNGTIKLWDSKTGNCDKTIKTGHVIVHAIAALSNQQILSVGHDKTLKLWDINTGDCLKTIQAHTDLATCLELLPYGLIATGSTDKTIKIWDAQMLSCLKVLEGHTARVQEIVYIDDNLVSTSEDRTIRVWGKLSAVIQEHKKHIKDVYNAIIKGDIETVKKIVPKKLHPDFMLIEHYVLGIKAITCHTQYSMLHLAVNSKKIDIIRYLIEQGADVLAKTNADDIPLHWAVDDMQYCKLLLKQKASEQLNSKNNHDAQHTPYDSATATKHPDIARQLALLEAQQLLSKAQTDFNKNRWQELIKLIKQHDCINDVIFDNEEGHTLLHIAVINGRDSCVKNLLTIAGIDLSYENIESTNISELSSRAINIIRTQGKANPQAKTYITRMESLMAISEELKTAENYFYLGNLQLEIGEYEKAIKTLTIGISKEPNDESTYELYYHRALAYAYEYNLAVVSNSPSKEQENAVIEGRSLIIRKEEGKFLLGFCDKNSKKYQEKQITSQDALNKLKYCKDGDINDTSIKEIVIEINASFGGSAQHKNPQAAKDDLVTVAAIYGKHETKNHHPLYCIASTYSLIEGENENAIKYYEQYLESDSDDLTVRSRTLSRLIPLYLKEDKQQHQSDVLTCVKKLKANYEADAEDATKASNLELKWEYLNGWHAAYKSYQSTLLDKHAIDLLVNYTFDIDKKEKNSNSWYLNACILNLRAHYKLNKEESIDTELQLLNDMLSMPPGDKNIYIKNFRDILSKKTNSDFTVFLSSALKSLELYSDEQALAIAIQQSLTDQKSLPKSQVSTLASKAKTYGFNCKNVRGDGNCFFYAVADQLNQHLMLKLSSKDLLKLGVTLRKIAIRYLCNNQKQYEAFIADDTFDNFIEENKWDGTSADHVLMNALCHALNLTMVSVRDDNATPTIFRLNDPACTIYLGYNVGTHYQSLVKSDKGKATKDIQTLIDKTETDDLQVTPLVFSSEKLVDYLLEQLESENTNQPSTFYQELLDIAKTTNEESRIEKAIRESLKTVEKNQKKIITTLDSNLFFSNDNTKNPIAFRQVNIGDDIYTVALEYDEKTKPKPLAQLKVIKTNLKSKEPQVCSTYSLDDNTKWNTLFYKDTLQCSYVTCKKNDYLLVLLKDNDALNLHVLNIQSGKWLKKEVKAINKSDGKIGTWNSSYNQDAHWLRSIQHQVISIEDNKHLIVFAGSGNRIHGYPLNLEEIETQSNQFKWLSESGQFEGHYLAVDCIDNENHKNPDIYNTTKTFALENKDGIAHGFILIRHEIDGIKLYKIDNSDYEVELVVDKESKKLLPLLKTISNSDVTSEINAWNNADNGNKEAYYSVFDLHTAIGTHFNKKMVFIARDSAGLWVLQFDGERLTWPDDSTTRSLSLPPSIPWSDAAEWNKNNAHLSIKTKIVNVSNKDYLAIIGYKDNQLHLAVYDLELNKMIVEKKFDYQDYAPESFDISTSVANHLIIKATSHDDSDPLFLDIDVNQLLPVPASILIHDVLMTCYQSAKQNLHHQLTQIKEHLIQKTQLELNLNQSITNYDDSCIDLKLLKYLKKKGCCLTMSINPPSEKQKTMVIEGRLLVVRKTKDKFFLGFCKKNTQPYLEEEIKDKDTLNALKEHTGGDIDNQSIINKIFEINTALGGSTQREDHWEIKRLQALSEMLSVKLKKIKGLQNSLAEEIKKLNIAKEKLEKLKNEMKSCGNERDFLIPAYKKHCKGARLDIEKYREEIEYIEGDLKGKKDELLRPLTEFTQLIRDYYHSKLKEISPSKKIELEIITNDYITNLMDAILKEVDFSKNKTTINNRICQITYSKISFLNNVVVKDELEIIKAIRESDNEKQKITWELKKLEKLTLFDAVLAWYEQHMPQNIPHKIDKILLSKTDDIQTLVDNIFSSCFLSDTQNASIMDFAKVILSTPCYDLMPMKNKEDLIKLAKSQLLSDLIKGLQEKVKRLIRTNLNNKQNKVALEIKKLDLEDADNSGKAQIDNLENEIKAIEKQIESIEQEIEEFIDLRKKFVNFNFDCKLSKLYQEHSLNDKLMDKWMHTDRIDAELEVRAADLNAIDREIPSIKSSDAVKYLSKFDVKLKDLAEKLQKWQQKFELFKPAFELLMRHDMNYDYIDYQTDIKCVRGYIVKLAQLKSQQQALLQMCRKKSKEDISCGSKKAEIAQAETGFINYHLSEMQSQLFFNSQRTSELINSQLTRINRLYENDNQENENEIIEEMSEKTKRYK